MGQNEPETSEGRKWKRKTDSTKEHCFRPQHYDEIISDIQKRGRIKFLAKTNQIDQKEILHSIMRQKVIFHEEAELTR